MTKEQYDLAKKELEKEFEEKKKFLAIDFARENNPYKQGDIISDHYKTIKIERWKTTYGGFGYPSLIYYGTALKKDGTPAKNQKENAIYQENIA